MKDSLSSLQVPSLVRHYIDAHGRVFGKRVYVVPAKYGLFRVFEDELRELDVPLGDYAFKVTRMLKGWTISKNMNMVPLNVFCGDWALRKYIRLVGYDYADVVDDDKEASLYHSEMLVARLFIDMNSNGNVCRIRDVIELLRPLLSDVWIVAHRDGEDRMQDEVMEDLCEEYGLRYAWTYNDFIGCTDE